VSYFLLQICANLRHVKTEVHVTITCSGQNGTTGTRCEIGKIYI